MRPFSWLRASPLRKGDAVSGLGYVGSGQLVWSVPWRYRQSRNGLPAANLGSVVCFLHGQRGSRLKLCTQAVRARARSTPAPPLRDPHAMHATTLWNYRLQVSRYRRQFPSPCSPNRSLLAHAARNCSQSFRRTGRRQVSRYLRQLPSPRSPSLSFIWQARRNSSHCPPRPRPSSTRTPPGPICTD
jgi:hypothetical protein